MTHEDKPAANNGVFAHEVTPCLLDEPISFEISDDGLCGVDVRLPDSPQRWGDGCALREKPPALPSMSEPMAVRHFTRLSRQNYSIDTCMYPLGSCTMKYNPRLNEKLARLDKLAMLHPAQPLHTIQGALEIMFELQRWLGELSGLKGVALSPAAGAHGELTGILVISKALAKRGDGASRKYVIVPESAHGTNPSTAAMCGFKVLPVAINKLGFIDFEQFEGLLKSHGDQIAAAMITNPNTCGLFEIDIKRMADLLHSVGAFLYCDGANFNAIAGKTRPADFGVDVMQFNLHKTFSTPHGGGGPGCGPVAVCDELAPFLPAPIIEKKADGSFGIAATQPGALGKVKGFYGQFLIMVRAYAYMLSCGLDGIKQNSEDAVLNANYIYHRLKGVYDTPYLSADNPYCMHECLLTDAKLKKEFGVTTLDIAKALIDKGFHPMTVFFPIILQGVMLIEPTETEGKRTLDAFIDAMLEIAEDAKSALGREGLKACPTSTMCNRLDDFTAAKNPILTYDELCLGLA